MTTRYLIGFPLILVLSVSAVGRTTDGAAQATRTARDEEGVRKLLADFIEAWNQHDAKAFSMVFAEDADFTNVGGNGAHGRADVEKFHAPLFATNLKDTHQTMTKTEIRFIKPDVASVDAWWEMTGAKGPAGQDIPLRKGLLNFVMTSEGARWTITVMHNMNFPARRD